VFIFFIQQIFIVGKYEEYIKFLSFSTEIIDLRIFWKKSFLLKSTTPA